MTIDVMRPWLEVFLVLWNIGLSAAVWLRKPGMDASAAVGELRTHVTRLENDISVINTRMDAMPTSEELKELEGSVKQIAERTSGMLSGMGTMQTTLTRIENYLLNSKT